MIIEYLGHASFLITTNENVRIITDPYQGVGYEMREGLQADILTMSHSHFDHNYMKGVQGEPLILNQAEDKNSFGIPFQAVKTFHDERKGALRGENIVFSWQVDDWKFCHLGDLGEACREDILEKLGEVDVLFIPIGGKYTIDAVQAKEYVEKLKPQFVIPMHYKTRNLNIDIDKAQGFLDLFEDEDVDVCHKDELEFSREDLTEEKTKIILMERTQ
jgi:L-ascorbate metabolism protein UlaG (beta-lactamase superfamily)